MLHMHIQIEIVLTEIQLYRGGHRKTNAEERGANVSVKGQPASACEEPEGADPCSPAQRGTGALSRLCRSDAQQMHRKDWHCSFFKRVQGGCLDPRLC